MTYKKSLNFTLLIILILTALWKNPLTQYWNAHPETYYFYLGVFSTMTIYLISDFINLDFKLSVIDIYATCILCGLVIIGLIEEKTTQFFYNDNSLSVAAATSIYVFFKNTRNSFKWTIPMIITISVTLEISVCIIQIITNFNRPFNVYENLTGTFRNSGILAVFLSSTLPIIILTLNQYSRHLTFKLFLNVVIMVVVIIILMVKSRTGFILLLIILVYWTKPLLSKYREKFKLNRPVFRIAFFLFLLSAFTLIFILKYPSAIGRLFIWKVSLGMFLDQPLLGWGPSGFERNYLHYQAQYFKTHEGSRGIFDFVASDVTNPFNEYVMLLIQFGIVGLAAFIYSICKTILVYIKHRSRTGDAYGLSLLLILVSCLFYYSLQITMILIVAAAALSHISSMSPIIYTSKKSIKYMVFCLLMSITMAFLYKSFVQFNATRRWEEAQSIWLKDPINAKYLLKKAYPTLKNRSNFLYNYGTILFQWNDNQESIIILEECKKLRPSINLLLYLGQNYQKVKNENAAEQCFKEAAYSVPSRFIPKYFLVKLYLQFNRFDKAFMMANEIIHMPIKIPSRQVNIIRADMMRLVKDLKTSKIN
jgi:O-antigen polymerase